MVLVLDDEATRVISSVLTMYDIMEERVTLVEQLNKNRQPFREMEVIYLVSPTLESAVKISQDFTSEAKAKYGGVHIYFLDAVSFIHFFLDYFSFDFFLSHYFHPSSSYYYCFPY